MTAPEHTPGLVNVPKMFGTWPNIRGTIYSWAGQQTGAFYQISTAEASATFDLPQSAVNGFDANRESSIFAGDKLQPAALQCLPCIKL